ncbi:MAG: energy transducer TonB [Chthoniobacterales bacterium]
MKLNLAIFLSVLSLTATHAPAQPLTAVLASGQTISYARGAKPPWEKDLLERVAPDYSPWQRERHNQGTGLYKGTIDVMTGAVVKVEVPKSAGVISLDEAVIVALKQWRFKPRKWREFEIFVSFVSFSDQQLYRDYLRRMQDRGLEQIPVRPGR